MTRNLVVVRGGRRSLHPGWVLGAQPDFDLLVTAYEDTPDTPTPSKVRQVFLPGRKIEGYHRLFTESPWLLRDYEQIALFDDDLECNAIAINRLFSEGKRYSLELYQPSLTWNSYISYGIFLHNPLTQLRFVNFIEMMCPVFSSSMLRRVLPLFSLELETAIDLLWCRVLEDAHHKFAIVDTAPVRHTRAVGERQADQGFIGENAYQTVVDKMQLRIGIVFRGPVTYAAVLRSGKLIEGRLKMAAISLAPLLSRQKPKDSTWYYRPIADHVRHNLTRPIGNEPIDLDFVLQRLSTSQRGSPSAVY
jgi:hypothetical protein